MDDGLLQDILQGDITNVSLPPTRIIKIFLLSPKKGFLNEKKSLKEILVPKLVKFFSPLGLNFDVIDTLSAVKTDLGEDPYIFQQYLQAIKYFHDKSTGCFLLCFLDENTDKSLIPSEIPKDEFNQITSTIVKDSDDMSIINKWYHNEIEGDKKTMRLTNPADRFPELHISTEAASEWGNIYRSINRILDHAKNRFSSETKANKLPAFRSLIDESIKLSADAKDRIICIKKIVNENEEVDSHDELSEIISHFHTLRVEKSLNEDDQNSELYVGEMMQKIENSIKEMTKMSIQSNLSLHSYLNLNRTVQELLIEAQTHLYKFRQLYKAREKWLPEHKALIDKIGQLLQDSATKTRNTPVVIYGDACSGKTSIMASIFKESEIWLGRPIVRIVRRIGTTPQSYYPTELLRSLCHHITLAFGFESLPKRFSYDFGRLCIWFQDLLKLVEATGSELLIILDDVSKLKVPSNNRVSIFGWIPWNLPSNVHIVISILENDAELTNIVKSRVSSSNCFIKVDLHLNNPEYIITQIGESDSNRKLSQMLKDSEKSIPLWLCSIMSSLNNLNLETIVNSDKPEVALVDCVLSGVESRHGKLFVERISLYLMYATYGLTESELADLLSVEESSKFEIDYSIREKVLSLWPAIRSEVACLLEEEYLDGRIYVRWKNEMILNVVKERYSGNDWSRKKQIHVQLSKYFLLSFIQTKDHWKSNNLDSQHGYQVPDTRCIEELWNQLLKAGDFTSLKKFVVCSFHFLLTSLSAMSVSYVRSLLELIRYEVLHWELEIILNIMKLSVDILSCDSYQLASEIINWLSPLCISDGSSSDIQALVSQAKEWCQTSSLPILKPYSSWLNFTLPQQAINPLTTEDTVRQICITRDNQRVIYTTDGKDIIMYHIASKQKEHVYSGHRNRVTCIHISYNGKMLISGSEDTTVLVWSVTNGRIRYVISEHISGILSVATTHNDSLVISGCSFGSIIISQLRSGALVQKINHHRRGITSIQVNQNDDILVTGSSDGSICLWSLEDYSLLNSMKFDASVVALAVSSNNIFLLVACADETIHVKSLTTGSDIHRLNYHPPQEVTSICCGWDNSRAVVGCVDGKIYVYDIHSSQLVQTLSGHLSAVTSIQIIAKDHFMVTAGADKIVIWNFASNAISWMEKKPKQSLQVTINHDEAITCMALSRDGSVAATGGKDSKVKVWQVNTSALVAEFTEHTAPITSITFAQNGLFVVSGSEDKTVRVWSITLSLMISSYHGHESKITNVAMTGDSQRVVSSDSFGVIRLWLAENGAELTSCHRPGKLLSVQGGMAFIVGGKCNNTLRMWPLCDPEAERSVSHMEAILCFTTSYDMKYIITGSQDMSLKVWEAMSCKLTQVLAGHDGAVSCVAVSPLVPSLVVSGSHDFNVIVWDMLTGSETHTLVGHTATVNCVKLTLDGAYVVSGSSDNMAMISSTRTGQRISMFDLHSPVASVYPTLDAKYFVVQLEYSKYLPVMCLLNSPVPKKVVDDYLSMPQVDNYLTNGVMKGVGSERRRRFGREQSVDWERKSLLSATRCLSSLSLDDFSQLSPCASQETLLRDPIHVAPFAHPKEKRYGVTPNSRISAINFKRPRSKMLLRQNTVNITLPESLEKIIRKENDIQELSKAKSVSSEAVNVSNQDLLSNSKAKANNDPEICSIS